jgi:peroxiredoxin Q/BCP
MALWMGLASAGVLLGAMPVRADVEVGQPAPDFRLPDQDNHLRSLADFKGKILILAFYPKDFTGG